MEEEPPKRRRRSEQVSAEELTLATAVLEKALVQVPERLRELEGQRRFTALSQLYAQRAGVSVSGALGKKHPKASLASGAHLPPAPPTSAEPS